jgi:hypothetical protein
MSNRYHLPVVVTTDDETPREEVTDYVERVLANLEETDFIYRTYVEQSELSDEDASRMIDMLKRVDDEDISDAIEAFDVVTEEETDE